MKPAPPVTRILDKSYLQLRVNTDRMIIVKGDIHVKSSTARDAPAT
jgi:hypothetical protein